MQNLCELYEDCIKSKTKTAMDKYLEAIQKAKAEAINRGIRANSIIINSEYRYVIPFPLKPGTVISPMLCGMRAVFDTLGELPEEYAFAIVDSDPPKTERDKIRAELLEDLSSLSVDDLIKEVYGVDVRESEDD